MSRPRYAARGSRELLTKRIAERRRDVEKLSAQGMTDRAMGETLGVSHYVIWRDRQVLGLPSSRNRGEYEHGNYQKYRYEGCRCSACKSAQAESLRRYRRKRAEKFWRDNPA